MNSLYALGPIVQTAAGPRAGKTYPCGRTPGKVITDTVAVLTLSVERGC